MTDKHKEKKREKSKDKSKDKDKKRKHPSFDEIEPLDAAAQQQASADAPPGLQWLLSSTQPVRVTCPVDLERDGEDDAEEEAWALRLPPGLSLELLQGCLLHLPRPPPTLSAAARGGLTAPGAVDALTAAEAAQPAQHLGHLALDPAAAARAGVAPLRTLHIDAEIAAARLAVLAPRGAHGGPARELSCKPVARLISVGDDAPLLCAAQRTVAATLGTSLWGEADGWDGAAAARPARTRVAGWTVQGSSSGGKAAGDADRGETQQGWLSEEEFVEDVFEARDDGAVSVTVRQQPSAARAARRAAAGGLDWDWRGHSRNTLAALATAALESAEGEGEEADDGRTAAGGPDDDGCDLAKFLLSLPIQPAVAFVQQAAAAEGAAHRALRERNAADRAAAKRQRKAQHDSQHVARTSSSDSGSPPVPDDEVDDTTPPPPPLPNGRAPPPTVAQLIATALAPRLTAALERLEKAGKRRSARLLRNGALVRLLDWNELCKQLDMEKLCKADSDRLRPLLKDAESAQLHSATDAQRKQVSCLLLPSAEPAPRPHYTDVDQGYAPYQRRDAPPVLAPSGRLNPTALDAALAEALVAAGAGARAVLTDTAELRARGYAWDDDPEELQREGLHVG